MLGLRPRARASSSRGKWGPLLIAVHGPPTVAASLAAEHRLQTRRLSNHGSRAQPLRGTWDPPRPGLEPASPALAGRFPTTVPPGKPKKAVLFSWFCFCFFSYRSLSVWADEKGKESKWQFVLFSKRKILFSGTECCLTYYSN